MGRKETEMATKKKTAEELTEVDAPEIDTEDAAEEPKAEGKPAEESELKKENDDLKAMMQNMKDMMLQMQTQMQQQQDLIAKMASGEMQPERPKTQTDIDAEKLQKIAKEAAEAGKDPWTIEVDVFVPHRDKGEDRWYWVNINDRAAQIPADDRRQKMKLPFAMILVDMLKAKQREEEFIDSVEVYDPKDNPHKGRP